MANLPNQCLCFNLRVGVAIYGTLGLMLLLGLITYIIVDVALNVKYMDDTFFWIFLGIAGVCTLIWIIRAIFLIKGVYMGKIKMMRGYYHLMVFDLTMSVLYSIRQIIESPICTVGILIGLGIGFYHLLCVKSLLVKMENEPIVLNGPKGV